MQDDSGVFDVRTTFPAGCDLDNPTVKETVHKINLMVFFLEGLKYKDFFTANFGTLVQGLIPKVAVAHEKGLVTEAERDQIVGGAKELVEALEGSSLMLRDMLVTKREDLPPGIWEPSRKMKEAGVSLPYYDQPDEKKGDARKVFDDGFLNDNDAPDKPGVGNLTEHDLFTTPAKPYPKVHAIVQRAKGAVILDNKPNNMACDWPSCVPYPDLFCTEIDDECTLNSDPNPG